MSDAFMALLVGGAYTVVVFVAGMALQRWLHGGEQAYHDEREHAIIEAMAHGQMSANVRAWGIPDDEQ